MTPMQLATAGYSVPHGAALLVLRQKCSLGTARKAMQQVYRALGTPVGDRLTHGLTKAACDAVGAEYVNRPVMDTAGRAVKPTRPDQITSGRGQVTDEKSLNRAKAACQNPDRLMTEWGIEFPGPVPPALRNADRSHFEGQKRANGKPLG